MGQHSRYSILYSLIFIICIEIVRAVDLGSMMDFAAIKSINKAAEKDAVDNAMASKAVEDSLDEEAKKNAVIKNAVKKKVSKKKKQHFQARLYNRFLTRHDEIGDKLDEKIGDLIDQKVLDETLLQYLTDYIDKGGRVEEITNVSDIVNMYVERHPELEETLVRLKIALNPAYLTNYIIKELGVMNILVEGSKRQLQREKEETIRYEMAKRREAMKDPEIEKQKDINRNFEWARRRQDERNGIKLMEMATTQLTPDPRLRIRTSEAPLTEEPEIPITPVTQPLSPEEKLKEEDEEEEKKETWQEQRDQWQDKMQQFKPVEEEELSEERHQQAEQRLNRWEQLQQENQDKETVVFMVPPCFIKIPLPTGYFSLSMYQDPYFIPVINNLTTPTMPPELVPLMVSQSPPAYSGHQSRQLGSKDRQNKQSDESKDMNAIITETIRRIPLSSEVSYPSTNTTNEWDEAKDEEIILGKLSKMLGKLQKLPELTKKMESNAQNEDDTSVTTKFPPVHHDD